MALRGTKRAASKVAGAKSGGGLGKKCKTIARAVRDAQEVPQPVRWMLCQTLVRTFNTYKEDRHPLQATCSDLVGDILKGTQGKLEAAISEAQEKKASLDTATAAQMAGHNAAVAHQAANAQAHLDAKQGVADSKVALTQAKSSLNDLEVAAKTAEADAAAATAKKEKLEALSREFIAPIRDGTKLGAGAGKHVGKELASNAVGLEAEFLECVSQTFSKKAAAWGTFDNIIDKKVEAALQNSVTGLSADIAAMASAKEARAAEIEGAKAAVTAAGEKVTAMEEACATASAAAKEADNAAKASAATVRQDQQVIQKAADVVAHAEATLATFMKGAVAAYTEVEARAAPPPAPEPEKTDEAAPLVEAVMQPEPTAAAAPSVLPSPGMLSRAAQAVGLAPSPRTL